MTISILAFCPLLSQPVVIDESHLDRSFLQFKAQLIEAVLEQDTTLLAPLLHHTVAFSFDAMEEESSDDLLQLLGHTKRLGESRYWDELYTLISWGFLRVPSQQEGPDASQAPFQFQAPSFLSAFDYWDKLVVTGRHVNIRKGPGLTFPVIRQASWEAFEWHSEIEGEIVAETLYDGQRTWVELVLPDGSLGYVTDQYASSRLLCELIVAKFDDGWKVVSFYHQPGC